jgi:hypothetical protein
MFGNMMHSQRKRKAVERCSAQKGLFQKPMQLGNIGRQTRMGEQSPQEAVGNIPPTIKLLLSD